MHSELGQANVLRTQHLRSARVKRKRAQTIQPCLRSAAASDVERTVSRSHITNSYQENINQSPDSQASETEELAKTLSPLAQIKAICPETAKCDATQKKKNTETSQNCYYRTCAASKGVFREYFHEPISGCHSFTSVLMPLTICTPRSSHKTNVSESVSFLERGE